MIRALRAMKHTLSPRGAILGAEDPIRGPPGEGVTPIGDNLKIDTKETKEIITNDITREITTQEVIRETIITEVTHGTIIQEVTKGTIPKGEVLGTPPGVSGGITNDILDTLITTTIQTNINVTMIRSPEGRALWGLHVDLTLQPNN